MKAILAAIALMSVPTVACGETKATSMMGIGTTTCAKFAELYRLDARDAENAFLAWTQGFMSGVNASRVATKERFFDLGSLSVSNQADYLRAYCDQHPLGDYLDAVMDLMNRLRPSKISN